MPLFQPNKISTVYLMGPCPPSGLSLPFFLALCVVYTDTATIHFSGIKLEVLQRWIPTILKISGKYGIICKGEGEGGRAVEGTGRSGKYMCV